MTTEEADDPAEAFGGRDAVRHVFRRGQSDLPGPSGTDGGPGTPIPAMIGFIITAVGIPVFGVAAIGITHSDGLQTLAGKVSKGYGIFFTCLLYLTIGPLFAIPRCATVSFTTGVAPHAWGTRGGMAVSC